jgi:hypothetical protein
MAIKPLRNNDNQCLRSGWKFCFLEMRSKGRTQVQCRDPGTSRDGEGAPPTTHAASLQCRTKVQLRRSS